MSEILFSARPKQVVFVWLASWFQKEAALEEGRAARGSIRYAWPRLSGLPALSSIGSAPPRYSPRRWSQPQQETGSECAMKAVCRRQPETALVGEHFP